MTAVRVAVWAAALSVALTGTRSEAGFSLQVACQSLTRLADTHISTNRKAL